MTTQMTVTDVVNWLRQRGKANTARIYRQRGAADETLGVSYKDIDTLAKKLGVDHAQAMELWGTGLHDLQLVACKIADPQAMTRPTIRSWVRDCRDYLLSDAVSGLAARMQDAEDLAAKWTASKAEITAATGWNVFAILAMDGVLDSAKARRLLARIRAGIHAAPNRARHSMNMALIAIGGSLPEVREEALAIAEAIGRVEVNHGETGCVTPEAAPYIRRMASRPPRRTRHPRVRA